MQKRAKMIKNVQAAGAALDSICSSICFLSPPTRLLKLSEPWIEFHPLFVKP